MIDTSEQAPPEAPAASPAPAEEASRRRWPLLTGAAFVLVLGSAGTLHGLGGKKSLIVAGVVVAAAVAVLVLWRLPHLRKHFARPRSAGAVRSRTARSAMRRTLGGGKRGKLGLPSLGGKRAGGKGKLLGGSKTRSGKGLLGRGSGKSLLGKARGGGKALLGKGRGSGKSLLGKGRSAGRSILGKGRGAGKALTGKGRRGSLPGKGRAGGLPGKGRRGGVLGKGRAGGRSLRHPFSGGRKGGLRLPGAKGGLRLPGAKRRAARKAAAAKAGTSGAATGRKPFKATRAAKGIRSLGRGTRSAFRGLGRGTRSLGRGTRAAARGLPHGTRSAWGKARKKTSKATTGQPSTGKKPGRARKAAEVAAAVPLVPFIAAAAAGRRLGAWFRKRRAARKVPAAAETPAAAAETPVKTPARQPGADLSPVFLAPPDLSGSTLRKETRNMSGHIESAVESIREIGGFEPENVADLDQFLQAMPDVYEALGSAWASVADRFGEELPVDHAVVEHIRELASQSAGLHDYASETHGLFRSVHEEDLNRIEDPRPGETFLDVGNQ